MANWDKAKRKAREVYKKYSSNNEPVDVFEIATNEDIQIVYFQPNESTNNISGALEKAAKKLFLNACDSPERQRFTAAHELGHYFLGHNPNAYGVYKRTSFHETDKPDEEKEADLFAAELLMPSELVKKYLRKTDNELLLARMFGVSPQAMKYRLQNLGLRFGKKVI